MDIFDLSIKDTAKLLSEKKISSYELTKESLKRAKKLNSLTNAYVKITDDFALKIAKKSDELLANGFKSFLAGIPFSMKDVYMVKSLQTTAASKVLKDYRAQYDSTVYKRIGEQSGVLVGKNNQDAWGHGGSSENTDFGKVKNPWDVKRTAGGSSGGSAAAVSGRSCFYSLAEDTGGSIRNPSSFCNLTGVKPTYGLVSRYGVIAYGSSLDTMGPIAKSAEDCAIILSAIAGHDPKDASSSRNKKIDYLDALKKPVKKLRIGLLEEFGGKGIDPDVNDAMQSTVKKLEDMGASIKKISIPILKSSSAIYYVLVFAETSSNLARFDGIRYGHERANFTKETKRRILMGSYDLSSGYYDKFYKKAQLARTALIKDFQKAFSGVDAVLYPVMPFPAFEFGSLSESEEGYVISLYKADIYTCVANILGVPSVAFPTGFSKKGLPIGLQLMGPMFSEAKLLNIIHKYQLKTDWHKKKPELKYNEKS